MRILPLPRIMRDEWDEERMVVVLDGSLGEVEDAIYERVSERWGLDVGLNVGGRDVSVAVDLQADLSGMWR